MTSDSREIRFIVDVLFSRFISDNVIRFSAKVLTALCDQVEGIPISGLVVVGDGQAARSMALSGNAMKVPVLWAKGGTAQLHSGGSEVSVEFFVLFVSTSSCLNPPPTTCQQTFLENFACATNEGKDKSKEKPRYVSIDIYFAEGCSTLIP